MTIASELTKLSSTKAAIRAAIEDKGQNLSGVEFNGYPAKIAAISGGGNPPTPEPPEPWVRPADWLALPTVLATDQKFVGLHAIFPDANFLALSAAGNYTVDWGDGVVENFTSAAIAYHEYNYATYDVGNTTLCSRGYKQAIVTVTPQSGQTLTTLNLHQRHFACNSSYASGFLDISIAGPNISDLRIAAQKPASTVTVVNFNQLEQVSLLSSDLRNCEYLFYGASQLKSVASLVTCAAPARTLSVDLAPGGATLVGHGLRNGDPIFLKLLVTTTGVAVNDRYFVVNATADTFQLSSTFGGAAAFLSGNGSGEFVVGTSMGNVFVNCYSLATVPLFDATSVIQMNYMFSGCAKLTAVPLLNTATVLNMAGTFASCYSLTSVPLFNTTAVTNMSSMFGSCYSLTSVPLFDTAAVTNMSYMFLNCYSLISVPLFNTVAVTHMHAMFQSCVSLRSVPLFNMGSVVQMSSMFQNCYSLTSVPLFNTAAVTLMYSAFYNCQSLISVPLFNTAAVANMNSMFQNCYSLTSVPLFNTAAVTSMSAMFANCYSLTSVPLFDTAAVTSMSSMFYNCYSLTSVPAFDARLVIDMGGVFQACNSLSKIELTGMQVNFSVAGLKLSKARLEELFANVTPVASGKTLVVSGNPGAGGKLVEWLDFFEGDTVVPLPEGVLPEVGMLVTGTGMGLATGVSVAADITSDTLTLTNHGLQNGTMVSFSDLGDTTGVTLRRIYYVINRTSNTFQISQTPGGATVNLTGANSTMSLRYPNYITAVTPNVSFTLSAPPVVEGFESLTFHRLDVAQALLKNWSVSY